MKKIITAMEAVEHIQDGCSIMVGGFLGVGTPEKLIDAIIEKGVKDLTIIANDTSFVDKGVGRLVANKQVKRVITSHIGTNAETGNQMNSGELDVELVPQGTLAERIRAKGAGLGGVLTPTGIGTVVAEGKESLTIDDREYLVEKPLGADVALIGGYVVDVHGNTSYKSTSRNFNPLMATAADIVIVGAEEVVEAGEISPEEVVTPKIFVDYIVKG